jgi:hypothetical protein
VTTWKCRGCETEFDYEMVRYHISAMYHAICVAATFCTLCISDGTAMNVLARLR